MAAPGMPPPQQNLLDKLIAYAAPGLAVNRMAQRTHLAMSGGYTGAKIDRAQLSRWMPTAGSANTDTVRDLPMLRARSRDQMRNAPIALGALNTTVGHVVGTGLTYTPAIDAKYLGLTPEQAEAWQDDTKRRFAQWAGSQDCDCARQLDFYGLQELAFRTHLESGDAFILTPRMARPGRPARLALQLIEADRVCSPNRAVDTESLIDGIEINPETGESIACHVARKHPGGNNTSGNTWERVPLRGASTGRRNLLHLFKPLRPGQVRGVPWIAPILEPLKQIGRWSDAELNAAVVSGVMATFIKMDADAFQGLYDEDAQGAIIKSASKWSGEMESGKAINLMPGESIESPTPGRPNPAFDPFWSAMVRQIGMALEMPYEVLTMHFQSSYSAARAALLMAWKAFRSKRDLLAKTLCQPVLELWLADEVAEGRISCPGFFVDDVVRAAWCAAIWTGDGPGSIDPTKEVTAAKMRVELGISTKQAESILHDGVDWEQKHEQRVKEINSEKRDGIYVPPAGSPVMPIEASDDLGTNTAVKPGKGQPEDASMLLQTLTERMNAADARPQAAPQALHIDLKTAEIERSLKSAIESMAAAHTNHIKNISAEMPININLPQQPAPVVHVHPPMVNVAAPTVMFEATVPAAQVVVNNAHPTSAVQTVQRDENDEIISTTTQYK